MNPDGQIMAEALADAIRVRGSQSALAEAIGITQAAISHMVKKGFASAEYALPMSQVTGVPAWKLRPDLYPPEMFKSEAAE